MALECGPQTWNSCLNSAKPTCETNDPKFEGTMEIVTPDPQTGEFKGWFFPANGGPREAITGKCQETKPHMTVRRGAHTYEGEKSGTKNMRGKRKNSKAPEKGRKPAEDDPEWMGTKTT